MRFLTRQWLNGELADDEAEARMAACAAHDREMLPLLPPALRALVGAPDELGHASLHDGVVEWWQGDGERSLTLQVLCGDDPIGYRRIVIQYRAQVEVVGASPAEVGRWFADRETVLLHDEVDVLSDGRFEHRHLLWPEGEFGVRFADVRVISAPVRGQLELLVSRRRWLESTRPVVALYEAHVRLVRARSAVWAWLDDIDVARRTLGGRVRRGLRG